MRWWEGCETERDWLSRYVVLGVLRIQFQGIYLMKRLMVKIFRKFRFNYDFRKQVQWLIISNGERIVDWNSSRAFWSVPRHFVTRLTEWMGAINFRVLAKKHKQMISFCGNLIWENIAYINQKMSPREILMETCSPFKVNVFPSSWVMCSSDISRRQFFVRFRNNYSLLLIKRSKEREVSSRSW